MRNNVRTTSHKKVLSALLAAAFLFNVASEAFGASLFLPAADNKYDVNKDFYICSIDGTGDNLAVLLQDLHCHYDTQVKISEFLKNISKSDNFNKIFVEGASEDVADSYIRKLPQNIKASLTESLLKEGRISGAEYFFLTDEAAVPLYALENEELYSQNATRLEYILNTQTEVSAVISEIQRELKILQRNNLSFKSRKMLSALRRYENGKTGGNKYHKFLVKEAGKLNADLTKYPEILKFAGMETNINEKKVSKELGSFLAKAKSELPYGAYKELLGEDDLIKNLSRVSETHGIDLSAYKELKKYLSFYEGQNALNPLELYKEEKNLIAELLIKNAGYKEAETLMLSLAFDKLKNFMANKATDGEFNYIKDFAVEDINRLWIKTANTETFKNILPYFFEYRQYYLANEKRNYEFAERITKDAAGSNSVTAAVIGGFHTEKVKQLLLSKGLRVVVLTPKISGGVKEAEKKYAEHFSWQVQAKAVAAFINAFQLELFIQGKNNELIETLETIYRLHKNDSFGNLTLEEIFRQIVNAYNEGREEPGKIDKLEVKNGKYFSAALTVNNRVINISVRKNGKIEITENPGRSGKKSISPVIMQCIKAIFLLPLLPIIGTALVTDDFDAPKVRMKEEQPRAEQGEAERREETSVYELMKNNGLGAIYDGEGVGFGVYSKNAEKMELCLFDEKGVETRVSMVKDEATDVWKVYMPGIKPGQKYGFRAHGPYDPKNGHYFNPNKLAVDPYSFQQEARFVFDESLRVSEKGNIYKMDTRDSAPFVPKSVVTDLRKLDELQTRRPPAFAPHRSRIYELHVGGFTALKEDLPQAERGTLKGLGSPEVIAHLKRIGVNTVEAQPIQSDANDPYSYERGLRNNSGYQTVTFFALNPELGDPSRPGEDLITLKETIGKLSEAGIRFGMDVVDNHSGEGSADMDPSLCYRLLDNSTYYLLNPDDRSGYDDASGCGNAFNTSNPVVLNMMTKYKEMYALMGTRLFRHDLMAAAARNEQTREYDANGEYMQIFKNSRILSGIDKREGILVAAEGYMATGGVRGVSTYFTDNFHKDVFTWGSGFREAIRDFIMGRRGPGDIAWAIANPNNGKQSQPHVYYMGSHDGHPYAQLMAVLGKDNRANGWGNNDGPNEQGMGLGYGNERIPSYVASAMTILSFLQGPVMFAMGDEFLRTQHGNNNPYNQSNEYLNMLWNKEAPLAGYMNALAKYRAEHLTLDASLGDPFSGKAVNGAGDKDITWVHPEGRETASSEWNGQHFGFMISGDRLSNYGIKEDDTLVMMNMSDKPIDWKLPDSAAKGPWRVYSSTLHLDLSVRGAEVNNGKYLIMPGETVILYKPADFEIEREVTAEQAKMLSEIFFSDRAQLTDDSLLLLMRYAAKEKESVFAGEIMKELSTRISDDAKFQKIYLAAAALIETIPPLAADNFSMPAEFFENNANTRKISSILSAA
ncbi:MAG: hypothetical protein LBR69_03570 [Endomicrobium sp.]|jgi:glycogen operon protein|nr:hypothetical protein [Endomicrobium sp.]